MGTGTAVGYRGAREIHLCSKGDLRGDCTGNAGLSRATIGNIRQNLAFAFLYNTLGNPNCGPASFISVSSIWLLEVP